MAYHILDGSHKKMKKPFKMKFKKQFLSFPVKKKLFKEPGELMQEFMPWHNVLISRWKKNLVSIRYCMALTFILEMRKLKLLKWKKLKMILMHDLQLS